MRATCKSEGTDERSERIERLSCAKLNKRRFGASLPEKYFPAKSAKRFLSVCVCVFFFSFACRGKKTK